MADSRYDYQIIGGGSTFPNKAVNPSTLTNEIKASSIVATLDYIITDASTNLCSIYFLTALSGGDQTTLNAVVAAHQGTQTVYNSISTVDTVAVDGTVVVEDGISGTTYRKTLVSIDSTGNLNIPAGQKYKIGGVALGKENITGLTISDTPQFTNVNLSGLSASQIVQTDASKNLVSVVPSSAYNQNFETNVANIKMDGVGAVGSSTNVSRSDHVHPTDTTKATKIASPVAGDIVTVNAGGDIVDSGKKFNDVGTTASDIWSASQTNTAINNAIAGLSGWMKYKGVIDASTNPNYPAATVGDVYVFSVAGKIGGASGLNVEVGDMILCKVNSAAGTQAAVGANWDIIQTNVDGAVTSTDTISIANNIVIEAGTTGKIVKQSLASVDGSGNINIPTGTSYQINGVALGKENITGIKLSDTPQFTGANLSGLTASRALVSDASKNIIASTVTATELGYVSGVTSAIQTQLNAKQTNVFTTLGDLDYGGVAGAITRLPGNITTTKQFLSQIGTGAVSSTPSWASITSSDVGLSNVTNDAQLKRSANDFNTFTLKSTPVSGDIVLIEDSAASGVKKYTTIGAIISNASSIFGSQYIKASGTDQSTTATTPQLNTTLNAVSVPAGTYRIELDFLWRQSSTGNPFNAELREDGVAIWDIEVKNAYTGTTARTPVSFSFPGRVLSAGTHVLTLYFWSSSGNTSYIYSPTVEFYRVA